MAMLLVGLGAPIVPSSCSLPRTASYFPTQASLHTAWLKESWTKADGGDAFEPLCLKLLPLWEADEAGEHPEGKGRRETWEYGCQTVAIGAPGRLPTQMLICYLHSSEVWQAQSSQLYSYDWFLPEECKVQLSVTGKYLPHYFCSLWYSWCFSVGMAQNATSPEHCQQKWRDGLWVWQRAHCVTDDSGFFYFDDHNNTFYLYTPICMAVRAVCVLQWNETWQQTD